jgi:hypothetical protein
MVLYLCVLIVFSLHRESLKLILAMNPLSEVVLSQESCLLLSWCAGGRCDVTGSDSDCSRSRRSDVEDRG